MSADDYVMLLEAQLEAYGARWHEMEDGLPAWIKERLNYFHETYKEDFRLHAWGYEVIVAALAVLLYADEPGPGESLMEFLSNEDREVSKFVLAERPTAEQVVVALSLARAHRDFPDTSLAGSPSVIWPYA